MFLKYWSKLLLLILNMSHLDYKRSRLTVRCTASGTVKTLAFRSKWPPSLQRLGHLHADDRAQRRTPKWTIFVGTPCEVSTSILRRRLRTHAGRYVQ